MEILNKINKYLALPFLAMIWMYQKTVSPDHGFLKVFYPHGYCKFYPSCSEYARISLQKEGITSFPKIFKRISRCNPFTYPAIDIP